MSLQSPRFSCWSYVSGLRVLYIFRSALCKFPWLECGRASSGRFVQSATWLLFLGGTLLHGWSSNPMAGYWAKAQWILWSGRNLLIVTPSIHLGQVWGEFFTPLVFILQDYLASFILNLATVDLQLVWLHCDGFVPHWMASLRSLHHDLMSGNYLFLVSHKQIRSVEIAAIKGF